jgi:hypothetical protein
MKLMPRTVSSHLCAATFLLLPSSIASALPQNCTSMTIPAIASAHGVAGTYFSSDIWLLNRSTLPALFSLSYVCWGCAPSYYGRYIAEVTLASGETRQFRDAANTLFNAPETRGAVVISQCAAGSGGPAPFFASSRTYTDVPDGHGTNGTGVPAFSNAQATQTAMFIGLASNGGDLRTGYRTNVGIMSPYATDYVPVSVQLTLRDSSGLSLASGSVSVGGAPVQINDVFAALGVPAMVTTNATLLMEGSQPMYPYVTVIDNQSGDSTFLPFASGQ